MNPLKLGYRDSRAADNAIAMVNYGSNLIVGSSDDLRIGGLTNDAADGRRVAGQRVDVDLRPHVPDSGSGVTSARHQDVDGRVQGQAVNRGQVTVVVTDDLQVVSSR